MDQGVSTEKQLNKRYVYRTWTRANINDNNGKKQLLYKVFIIMVRVGMLCENINLWFRLKFDYEMRFMFKIGAEKQ